MENILEIVNMSSNKFTFTYHLKSGPNLPHFVLPPTILYLAFCEEMGKSGETPHLQGFFLTRDHVQFKYAKNYLVKRCGFENHVHVEMMVRSVEENLVYIQKEGGELHKWGEIPQNRQGKRSDIDFVRDKLNEGVGMREITQVADSYQSMRMAELWLKYNEPARGVRHVEVIWIWGGSGLGKSMMADKLAPHGFRPVSFKWWEGYDGQTDVIFDELELEGNWRSLLRFTDIYPLRVESKGGSRQVAYDRIIITSEFHPIYYHDAESDGNYNQLGRRISRLVHIDTYVCMVCFKNLQRNFFSFQRSQG